MPDPERFEVSIPDDTLADLRQRLALARVAPGLPDDEWRYGMSGVYLRELVDYWRDEFDWRAREREMNAVEHWRVVIDDVPIHYMRQAGEGPKSIPLVLTHGWPWTFWDFHKVLGPLADPAAFGGDPADAFDVIVPSLPGFGFSSPINRRGVNFWTTSDLWIRLMIDVLGYERFGAHGCDMGWFVTAQLGHKYGDRLIGTHVTGPARLDGWRINGDYVPWSDYLTVARRNRPDPALRDAQIARERQRFSHIAVHTTDPQTLAHGLHDSPVGLASWILQRRFSWSDCDGDIGSRFTKDDLLTTSMIYWATDTLWSSIRYYYEAVDNPWRPSHDRSPIVESPTGFSLYLPDRFPGARNDMAAFSADYNVNFVRVHESGGHFVPMEEPDTLVTDLRDFFRPLRASL